MQTSNRYLPFLDGVRASAALYVAIEHAYNLQMWHIPHFEWTLWLFLWGNEAVTTFIVLSGFCLGLQLQKPSTFWGFIQRRTRRLLPPYFAAIGVLCLLLILKAKVVNGIDLQIPLSTLLPNLLLVKEYFTDPIDWLQGSSVFWSVGIEYRLYWLLPLLTWGYRQGRDWSTALCLGLAIALLLTATLLSAWLQLPDAKLWLILPFAFGIVASQALQIRRSLLYPILCLATLVLLCWSHFDQFHLIPLQAGLTGVLFGGLMALLLVSAAQHQESAIVKLLASRLLHWFATWSYSLYLLHYALLKYCNLSLAKWHIYGWTAISLEVLPVMFGCWLFSQAFEQPFLKRRSLA